MTLEPDLTLWSFWWEFNKEPYLNLKKHIFKGADITGSTGIIGGLQGVRRRKETLKPTAEILRNKVVPALKQALKETKTPDIISSCLIALAKIGEAKDLGKIFSQYINDDSQEISETAIICFGIAGEEKYVPLLVDIFKDTEKGRKATNDRQGVHFRNRAFAAYALGLIAYSHKDTKIKKTVYEAAKDVLIKSKKFANRDIPVAAINAIRLLNCDLSKPEEANLSVEAAQFLLEYLKNKKNRFQMRAHVPTALSRLLGRETDESVKIAKSDDMKITPEAKAAALRREAIELMVKYLKAHKENKMILESCVLALGQMGNPKDDVVVEILKKTAKGELTRDRQARYFANISLGYLASEGAQKAESFLLKRILVRGKASEKPWVALGLGVAEAERMKKDTKEKYKSKGEVKEALYTAFRKVKDPTNKAGVIIAMGLAKLDDFGDELRNLMNKTRITDHKRY